LPQSQAANQISSSPLLGTVAFTTHHDLQQEEAGTPTLLVAAGGWGPAGNQQPLPHQAVAAAGSEAIHSQRAPATRTPASHTTSVITPGVMYHTATAAGTSAQLQQQHPTRAGETGAPGAEIASGPVPKEVVVMGVPVMLAAAAGAGTVASSAPTAVAAAVGHGVQPASHLNRTDRVSSRHRMNRDSTSPWPGAQAGSAAAAAVSSPVDVAGLESQIQ
jgi:hypothetical protein